MPTNIFKTLKTMSWKSEMKQMSNSASVPNEAGSSEVLVTCNKTCLKFIIDWVYFSLVGISVRCDEVRVKYRWKPSLTENVLYITTVLLNILLHCFLILRRVEKVGPAADSAHMKAEEKKELTVITSNRQTVIVGIRLLVWLRNGGSARSEQQLQ